MDKMLKKNEKKEIWEEDLFESYLSEMDELINKYPEDPNSIDLTEGKLHELIQELDTSWMAFRKKWQRKIKTAESVFATAKVKKGKSGMRHLVIKSEFNENKILDLVIPEAKDDK